VHIEHLKIYVEGFETSPYGVQWMRFDPDCGFPEVVCTVPHVAFEVDDLDAALAGKDVIIPPTSPSQGVRVAFIADDGAPVELLEYERTGERAAAAAGSPGEDVAATIVALERGALERWSRGDPGGFIDLAAEDIVYFDPYQPRRLDGREGFVRLMESIRGQVWIDRFELLDPVVQASGDLALLTFNFVSWPEGPTSRWNTTEVYRRDVQGWRLVQQHWSLTEQG
jgi:ketosteroid isomerase-like protein